MTLTTADVASSTGEDGLVASSAKGPRASQPKRRSFTAAYKLRIVEQYDQLADPRERGALLRREGLYHSHIQQWREARDKGALNELSDKRPAARHAVRRRWKTSGCGRKTRNSLRNWPGRGRRWR